MRNLSYKFVVPFIVFLATGCVSVPRVELETQRPVSSITFLKVVEPTIFPVVNLGGPAGAFGLIGGLVQAAVNDRHSKIYTEMVTERKLALASALQEQITATLGSAGYVVTSSGQSASFEADNRTVNYSVIDSKTDAILHVWFTTLGYVSPPNMISFQPWVGVRVRLVDTKEKKDLYFKTFACGYKVRAENVVHVPAEPQYEYSDFELLKTNFDASVEGLRSCERSIASLIRVDFGGR